MKFKDFARQVAPLPHAFVVVTRPKRLPVGTIVDRENAHLLQRGQRVRCTHTHWEATFDEFAPGDWGSSVPLMWSHFDGRSRMHSNRLEVLS